MITDGNLNLYKEQGAPEMDNYMDKYKRHLKSFISP